MTDPVKAAEQAIHAARGTSWLDHDCPEVMKNYLSRIIAQAQQEGIAEGKRLAAFSIESLISSGENTDQWTITRDLAFRRCLEAVTGKAAAEARPGVDREKVLGLLDRARGDVPANAIVYIIAAVRLLVGEK